jgi:osmotically-inducible protein OsmY
MGTVTVAPGTPAVRRTDGRAPVPAEHHIEIAIAGGTARLSGQVSSWTERRDIERAICDAPGVVRVENRLQVVRPAR